MTDLPGGRSLVLLVEDDRDSREMYTLGLDMFGLRTIIAGTAAEAMRVCTHERPDMIVTDLTLPDMDGIALCTALGQRPETAGVPVIALTGRSADGDIEQAMAAGARRVLVKPCPPDALADVIRQVLGRAIDATAAALALHSTTTPRQALRARVPPDRRTAAKATVTHGRTIGATRPRRILELRSAAPWPRYSRTLLWISTTVACLPMFASWRPDRGRRGHLHAHSCRPEGSRLHRARSGDRRSRRVRRGLRACAHRARRRARGLTGRGAHRRYRRRAARQGIARAVGGHPGGTRDIRGVGTPRARHPGGRARIGRRAPRTSRRRGRRRWPVPARDGGAGDWHHRALLRQGARVRSRRGPRLPT